MSQKNRCVGWICLWCLVFLGVTSPSLVSAQRTKQKSLQRLYQDGKRLVLRKRYRRALRVFRKVLQRMKEKEEAQTTPEKRENWRQQRARLLYVIGRTSEYASLWADAYKAYRECELLGPSDAMRNAIQKRLKELLTHIRSQLTLNTNPENTRIELIDAQGRVHQGRSPLKLSLPPGTTAFSVSRKGYEKQERRITLEPLQHTQLFLDLTPLQTRKVPPPPPPTVPWRVPVAWVSVGLGIASTIAGVALLIVSQQQLALYDEQRNASNASQKFLQDPEVFVGPLRGAQNTEAASIATFAGAGAFLGVALGFFLWPPAPPSTLPSSTPPSSDTPETTRPKQLIALP